MAANVLLGVKGIEVKSARKRLPHLIRALTAYREGR